MDWLRTLLSRCKAFLIRNKLDQELEEEFRSHLEFATEEHRKRGLPENDARRAALRDFGQSRDGGVCADAKCKSD